MNRRRTHAADDRGAVAVEFALVLPILLLLVFGIIDVGYMLNRDTMINNVSRDAARVASLGGTYSEVSTVVQRDLATYGLPASATTVTIDCLTVAGAACGATSSTYDTLAVSGVTTTVKINYVHRWMSPFMKPVLGSTITLSKQTSMRVE